MLPPQEKSGENQNHEDETGSQSIQNPSRHFQSDRHSQPACVRLLFVGLHTRHHVQRLESKWSHDSLLSKSFSMLFSEAQVIRFMIRCWLESRSCDAGELCILHHRCCWVSGLKTQTLSKCLKAPTCDHWKVWTFSSMDTVQFSETVVEIVTAPLPFQHLENTCISGLSALANLTIPCTVCYSR